MDLYEDTVSKIEANRRIGEEQERVRILRNALRELVESVKRAQNVNLDTSEAERLLEDIYCGVPRQEL